MNIKENRLLTVDRNFLKRVLNTSIFLSIIIVAFAISYDDGGPVTMGLAIGCAIDIVFFKVLWWTINRAFRLDSKKKTAFAAKVTLVKFPAAGIVIYYSFKYLHVNPFAFIGGLVVVQAVMLLKVVGMMMVNGINYITDTERSQKIKIANSHK